LVSVDGAGSKWTETNHIYLGWYGSGTLSITNGGSVSDGGGLYGGGLDVGYGMSGAGGKLLIAKGGTLSTLGSTIGYNSPGVAMVDGAGSVWTNTVYSLDIGSGANGRLSITGGGAVVADYVDLDLSGHSPILTIDIGRGSLLTVGGGTGTIINGTGGTIQLVAGAGVATDGTKYSPISAGTWGGSGVYKAIGGTWSSTGHTFTASTVTAGASGSRVSLNLASVQRALVDDNGPGGTNWEVGASFVAATSTKNITFTATAMNSTILDILRADLPANESILSGWTFATTNYTVSSTNPIYLSFNVGPGHPADKLDLWHYDGSKWTEYSPTDLTYDGTFASFTATGLSGYAMAAVPEPSTFILLSIGFISLLGYARRRRAGLAPL
jgi:T5SS/PEP-CTERM-associated repeat protein